MSKIATSTLLIIFLVSTLFFRCQFQVIPPEASKVAYVSGSQSTTSQRLSAECAIRYNLVNIYTKMDNEGQREAIKAGFDLWQKACPRIGFLDLAYGAILKVQFVDQSQIPSPTDETTIGLVKGIPTVAGGLQKESDGTYTILLSDTFEWTKNSLMKAIAYHAGLYLGMTTSTESGSAMSRLYANQSVKLSLSDSLQINKLYITSCRDLAGISFLPTSLKVSTQLTKTIRLDKQGEINVKASGFITTGLFVGVSGPEGKNGLLDIPIPELNIVPEFLHAALIYRINNETRWSYCGKECTIPTTGAQYMDITFNMNDNNQKDNSGAYDVALSYK
ncbi:hypothetical protein GCM10028807_53770 [Spirosoma daeguense]